MRNPTNQTERPQAGYSTQPSILRRLAGWLPVAVGLLLVASVRAQISLPVNERFPYTENERLGVAGNSGTNWNIGNSTGSFSPVTSNQCALAYPGLVASDSGEFLSSNPATPSPTSNRNRGIWFNTVSNGSVYVSLLLNIRAYPVGTKYFFALLSAAVSSTSNPSTDQASLGLFLDQFGRLSISKASETPTSLTTTPPLSLNNTYMIVLRYTLNPSGANNDEVSLWLNPTGFGASEGDIPPPSLTTISGGNDKDSINAFMLVHRVAANNPGGTYYFDEVRISTNWADVTPPTCAPGATFTVTGGGTNCGTASFPVGLSGSETGVDYWLFTNSVFTGTVLPGTGSPLDFGTQTEEGVYTVLGSNTTTSCIGYMSAFTIVDAVQVPGIAVQPSATTISSGGLGVISVVGSGEGISYQWRKNGVNLTDGGHISGATTPNLTIYPADGSDAATALNGYDVVVSGVCSPSATSTRVALTVKTPTSLVWQGDGVTDIWDVATTADWLDGLNLTVFNYGDPVTFNGATAFNTLANLSSPYLSPASINVVNIGIFRFAGTGAIIGPSTTLALNALGGELIMNRDNTYGGGTVLTAGTLSIDNNTALGSGPITLGGGTLNVSNQVTLGNAINVTGDSTVLINNTSTSALILTNILSGTGGTLTFINNTAARGPSFRLLYPGFVFSRPIVLSLGASLGTNLFLSCYNPTNDQVFNGIISGDGSVQRVADGGTTILNAINTYTNRTDVQGGTLLVNGQIAGTGPVRVLGGALGGSGTIAGPVSMAAGTLAPGNRAIGKLTINNDLTVTNAIAIEVDTSLTVSNDSVSVSGILTNLGPGRVTVTNLGPALEVGDRFVLFDKPLQNGSALTITGVAGVTWANDLQSDGSISVAAVALPQGPLITSIVPSGSDVIISGTNGIEGNQFLLLSSASLLTPLSGWTSESTNTFGAGGGFTVNAPVGGTEKFFLLKLYP